MSSTGGGAGWECCSAGEVVPTYTRVRASGHVITRGFV